MTQKEIAELLGIRKDLVKYLFQQARAISPSIAEKSKTYHNTGLSIDYTLEEAITALNLSRNGLSLAAREILEQEFVDPVGSARDRNAWSRYIDGSEEFQNELEKNNKQKCCSTCVYCFARVKKTRHHPFCSFYNSYLSRLNANPYKSFCSTYEYSGYAFFWKLKCEPEKKFITKELKDESFKSFGFADDVYMNFSQ